jgi:hypothetical protein
MSKFIDKTEQADLRKKLIDYMRANIKHVKQHALDANIDYYTFRNFLKGNNVISFTFFKIENYCNPKDK